MILNYLGDNGPASYETISKDLGIPQSTVENRIREILIKRHGLVRKLPNDKFALKWYTDEEETSRAFKKKLLRNPGPEELAGLIKKSISEARNLLFEYIPGYREPTKDDIALSTKILYKTIALGALDLPSKNELFERGIIKLVAKGIDLETLNEIIEKRPSVNLDDARSYLDEFPEMRPEVIFTEEHNWIMYNVKWSNDARILLEAIDSWKQMAEISIPRKFDKGNISSRLAGTDIVSGLDIAALLADLYVPSERIMSFLSNVAVEQHGDLVVLPTLKKYCQNALEVGQMDEKNKDHLVNKLIDVAFFGEYTTIAERNTAFDIIDLLGVRSEVIEIAMDYINDLLDEIPDDVQNVVPINRIRFKGPDIEKIAKWLARDPKSKIELEERIENLMKSTDYPEQAAFCKDILELIT